MYIKIKSRRTAIFFVAAVLMVTILFGSAFTVAAAANEIKVRQALDAVLDFMPDCDVESFQRTTNNGLTAYQFVVTDGSERYVILINAVSGEIENYTRETASVTQTNPPQTSAPVTPTVPVTPGNTYNQTQPSVNADSAKSAALAKVGGGTVARVETHNPPRGGAEYKVIVVYGDYKYCVHISGYDGSVTDMHSDPIVKSGPKAYNSSPAISATSAMSTAIQNAGGGIVTECTLEYKPHSGSLTYHIHVAYGQYEYCVELDATTGAVYKSEHRYKP